MKITVIGNSGGGKTTLSRLLGKQYKVPVIHIDSIQFLPGMIIRPMDETRKILNDIQAEENWLMDGYGPLDMIEKRFAMADKIIFIDMPLWRHYWWCVKRQMKSLLGFRRVELPEGCYEATLPHTIKLFKTVWKVHTQMRPELLRILNRPQHKQKLVLITNFKQYAEYFSKLPTDLS